MQTLSYDNMHTLDSRICIPTYKRDDVRPGIVHFGVGNFHRAHMQRYLHRLFNQGKALDWGIIGTGVTEYDTKMYQALKQQDYLTTLVAQDTDKNHVSILGVMTDFIDPADTQRIIDTLASAHIRIVSLTVTEGGYFIDAAGAFDHTHPLIQHDMHNPTTPKTVFGCIVQALIRRHRKNIPPFTVMSCDNLPDNGVVAKNAVVALAQSLDTHVATWIQTHVAFPNSMVDCITPATSDREQHIVRHTYNIKDTVPVFCENFTQWVLEDTFSMGRPPFETVGVQFTDDVADYEKMKIRILNGGHAIVAYASGLLHIKFVHEALQHPLIYGFLSKVVTQEICPLVATIGDMSPQKYYDIVVKRLLNPKIGDTVTRLCFDGSNRQPKFIVPSITERLQQGYSVTGLALASALWCRYCFGVTDTGDTIAQNDPNWHVLQQHAKRAKTDPTAWLQMENIYGDVAKSSVFADIFSAWLQKLWQCGVAHTLAAYIDDGMPISTPIRLKV